MSAAYKIGTVICLQYNHRTSGSSRYKLSGRAALLLPALPVISHPLVQQTASCKSTDFFVEYYGNLNPYLYLRIAEHHGSNTDPARARVRARVPQLAEQKHAIGLEPELFLLP